MARTYKQIQEQIAALQREAEALRGKEVDSVVARIKVAIGHYGLTAEQLGFGGGPSIARRSESRRVAGNRNRGYGDGLGNTWSGRGPRPRWLRDALAAGRTLEEFVAAGKTAAAKMPKMSNAKSSPGRRKAKTSYKDGAGHSWSGFGPRPAWLKEAIASGRTLEEFAS